MTKRVREKIEPETHTLLHFALKLHNHKSQEMNIIQMSSDEILMYVMSYIRSECERGLFFSPLIFSDTLSSSIVCLSAIEFGYSVEYLCGHTHCTRRSVEMNPQSTTNGDEESGGDGKKMR